MIGSQFFQSYTHNLARLKLIELIDDINTQTERDPCKASLVVNPYSKKPYTGSPPKILAKKPS